jgi:putative transposase
MPPEVRHRKTIQHFDIRGHAHELTFSCFGRRPPLLIDGAADLLCQSIDAALTRHRYSLLAYVLMPEHVHLLVLPHSDASPVERLLFAIKRPHSFRVKRLLHARNDPLLDSLIVRDGRGRIAFRFWQFGPGYDRNLTKSSTVRTVIEYIHANPIQRGLCSSPDGWDWSSWHVYADHRLAASSKPRVTVFQG